jgi:hypothetical protein
MLTSVRKNGVATGRPPVFHRQNLGAWKKIVESHHDQWWVAFDTRLPTGAVPRTFWVEVDVETGAVEIPTVI